MGGAGVTEVPTIGQNPRWPAENWRLFRLSLDYEGPSEAELHRFGGVSTFNYAENGQSYAFARSHDGGEHGDRGSNGVFGSVPEMHLAC
jgi:hypothetical protein